MFLTLMFSLNFNYKKPSLFIKSESSEFLQSEGNRRAYVDTSLVRRSVGRALSEV